MRLEGFEKSSEEAICPETEFFLQNSVSSVLHYSTVHAHYIYGERYKYVDVHQ